MATEEFGGLEEFRGVRVIGLEKEMWNVMYLISGSLRK